MSKIARAGLVSALLLVPVLAGCQSNASTVTATPTLAVSATSGASPTSGASSTAPGTASSTTGPRPSGPVPPQWGPAANGLVLYETTTGDIASIDLATGRTATAIGGEPRDALGGWLADGKRFLFERAMDGGLALWVADADGTDARMILDPAATKGWGWIAGARDGHRAVLVPATGGDATILDIDTGARSTLHAPIPIRKASWLADGRLLIVSASAPGSPSVFATINEDATGYQVVPTTDAVEEYSVSGDGTRFAYNSWGTEPGTKGMIDVVDLATGGVTRLTSNDPNFESADPEFSPDGRWVKTDRWDVVGLKIVLLAADGKGKPVELGVTQKVDSGEGSTVWAPDGSALVVTYSTTGETWLFDVASGTGQKVDWLDLGDRVSWQRVAP